MYLTEQIKKNYPEILNDIDNQDSHSYILKDINSINLNKYCQIAFSFPK